VARLVGWEDMSSRVSNRSAVEGTRHVQPCVTLGIDLASQPEDTAACLIDWSGPKGAVLSYAKAKLDDDELLRLMSSSEVSRVGIDAPFGWPMPFVDALVTYQAGGQWLPLDAPELRFRSTEFHVKAQACQQPLSAVTDRLIWPTMRCHRLLSRIKPQPVDRTGAGRVVEVYPAAALLRWLGSDFVGGTVPSYKDEKPGRREARAQIVTALADKTAAVLDLAAEFRDRCIDSDDVLDALVCALIARAADTGHVDRIPEGSLWAAAREGWITLPTPDSLPARI
jgi:hypothetical protein